MVLALTQTLENNMATKTARELKSAWMRKKVEEFEPLMFGELRYGQKFIEMPQPGDNEGQDGFRRDYPVFEKTGLQIHEGFESNAICHRDGVERKFEQGDLIIRLFI